MGKVLISSTGSGGIDPDECTASANDVISGKKFGGSGSDDPQTGTMSNHGQWTSRIGVNGRANIPAGYHNGNGYVDQSINNRGAWNASLGINGSVTIPEGYHSGGGRVSQSIPTMGGQNISPSSASQTVYCNGNYMTGNVVVNAISLPNASDLREGVNWYGRVGTLKDYSYLAQGQMSFNYGTFSKPFTGFNAEDGFWQTGNFYVRAKANGYNPWGACLKESINLTPFSKIILRIEEYNAVKKGWMTPYIGVCNYKPSSLGSATDVKQKTNGETFVDLELDVSGLSGHHFILLGATSRYSSSSGRGSVWIKQIQIV